MRQFLCMNMTDGLLLDLVCQPVRRGGKRVFAHSLRSGRVHLPLGFQLLLVERDNWNRQWVDGPREAFEQGANLSKIPGDPGGGLGRTQSWQGVLRR